LGTKNCQGESPRDLKGFAQKLGTQHPVVNHHLIPSSLPGSSAPILLRPLLVLQAAVLSLSGCMHSLMQILETWGLTQVMAINGKNDETPLPFLNALYTAHFMDHSLGKRKFKCLFSFAHCKKSIAGWMTINHKNNVLTLAHMVIYLPNRDLPEDFGIFHRISMK
jgi:hypothetical protein